MLNFSRNLNRLDRQQRGVATIELALSLPLLLIVFFYGSFELWQMMSASLRLDRTTNQVSASAARAPVGITEGEVTSILKAAERSVLPTELYKHGRVIISAVEGKASQKILWQRCMGDLTSFKGSIGGVGEKAKYTKLKFGGPPEDVILIVTESQYEHGIALARSFFPTAKLEHSAVAVGRDAISPVVVAKGTASSC
jgi:TadE-like protein